MATSDEIIYLPIVLVWVSGAAFSNYFTLRRPRGLTLSFEAILERVNTPFLLSLKRPPGVSEFKAEVSVWHRVSRLAPAKFSVGRPATQWSVAGSVRAYLPGAS